MSGPVLRRALLVMCALMLGLWAQPANALPYGTGGATISTTTPAAGSAVTVSGTGFAPNSEVEVIFFSTPQVLATTTANATGVATAEVTIPLGASGAHRIDLVGVDPASAPRTLSISITVASSAQAAPPGTVQGGGTSELPTTGSSSRMTVTIAFVAIAVGAGALLVSQLRRRRIR